MPKRKRNSEDEQVQQIKPQDVPKLSNQGDVYSRALLTKTQGRGSLAGWTSCPLCNANKKTYALGRGISMHLQQVHTPWNPGKAELARRQRIRRRVQGLVYKTFKGGARAGVAKDDVLLDVPTLGEGEMEEEYNERLLKYFLGNVWNRDGKELSIKYEAQVEETQEWSKRVVDVARQLEEAYEMSKEDGSANTGNVTRFVDAGLDRDGSKTDNYKDSLPPFIKAASDGNLNVLKQMVEDAKSKSDVINNSSGKDPVQELLETKDRNSSLAEDWAAGNGHLDCLKYLTELSTARHAVIKSESNCNKRRRKREGKTSLHYACRNGHLCAIKYLLEPSNLSSAPPYATVDITSGDGTTPLHLACYGGHFEVIQYLIEDRKADIYRTNDWGCGIGHWIAMSIQSNHEEVVNIFNYVKGSVGEKSFEVFGRAQKQGHSSVHKAAQKLNREVIEELAKESTNSNWTAEQRLAAGAEDAGGNKPSTVWCRMGGSKEFSDWMKKECDW